MVRVTQSSAMSPLDNALMTIHLSQKLCAYIVPFMKYSDLFVESRKFFLPRGATGRALDLRSTGRGFKSYSGQNLRNHLGQVVHTYVPLSPSSITWYRLRDGDALRLER